MKGAGRKGDVQRMNVLEMEEISQRKWAGHTLPLHPHFRKMKFSHWCSSDSTVAVDNGQN